LFFIFLFAVFPDQWAAWVRKLSRPVWAVPG
jgi:hypothetical protein